MSLQRAVLLAGARSVREVLTYRPWAALHHLYCMRPKEARVVEARQPPVPDIPILNCPLSCMGEIHHINAKCLVCALLL
jgi:hypothetical protein